MNAAVGIIMGSDSDLPVMQAAADILAELGVASELTIVSAHRTPERLYEYATSAEQRGLSVIVAGAGGAAHLPGMVAALTPLPVIGVPVSATCLQGHDALLSIVQMPAGVPVATVAIDNAANAGILAAQILATADPQLRQRIKDYKAGLRDHVLGKLSKLPPTRRLSFSRARFRLASSGFGVFAELCCAAFYFLEQQDGLRGQRPFARVNQAGMPAHGGFADVQLAQ